MLPRRAAFVHSLVAGRAVIAERGVTPSGVVPCIGQLEDRAGDFQADGPGPVIEQLNLHRPRRPTPSSNFRAVTDRVHRAEQPDGAQPLPECPGRRLG